MPITTVPEWQHMALYALGAALVLVILLRIPHVGRAVRFLLSLGLLAFCLFVLMQQAPYDPTLARIADRIGLDKQEVVGDEVRIRMGQDGHFWADATLNGVPRRMLIDSGATVTALSERTATEAAIQPNANLFPVVLRTAAGNIQAQTGRIDHLRVGQIEAQNLNVVITPALGDTDILGMNFLSQLASWRVEGRTLIMVPERTQGA